MIGFIVKRCIGIVPTLAMVGLIVFALVYVTPGDAAMVLAGEHAGPEEVEEIRRKLGLDRPFLVRFAEWLWSVMQGDLGVSIVTNVPVADLIVQRLEPTLSLMALTMLFSVVVAVPLGVIAGWYQDSFIDRLVMALSVLGFSVPVFVVGYLWVYFLSLKMGLLPTQGFTSISAGVGPFLSRMTLPVLSLGFVFIALISRITRTAMLEVLSQDYIRTAKAKGLGTPTVLFVHALKNAAVPISTVVGLGVGLLIGGSVVIETVFTIPGLGRLTVDAILRRDFPVIQGVVLFFSASYVLVNLLVDLLYAAFDPRIRY